MATRNERRKRAKWRMIDRLSKSLVNQERAEIGKQRDKVMSIVKSNLSKGGKPPIEERAWLGRGTSSIYQPTGMASAIRYGTGHTISVAKGPIKCGKVNGRGKDWTY